MPGKEIYDAALAADVLLYLKQDQLAYKSANGDVSDELRGLISLHKAQIVDYLRVIENSRGSNPIVVPPIQKVADRSRLPVSRAQRRVWLADLQSSDGSHFNIQGCFVFDGTLDHGHFRRAMHQLVRRHESLRTQFFERAGDLLQVVHDRDEIALAVADFSTYAVDAQTQAVKRYVQDDLRQRFDLSRDTLLRVSLLRLADDRHVAIFNLHHIISDGWSVGLLIEEFCQAYTAFHSEAKIDEALPFLHYGDFAAWQEGHLQGETLKKGLLFWRSYLQGMPEVHSLPLDRPRPARQTFEGELQRATIDHELEQRIREYCQGRKATLFMFLQTALSVLLGLYGNEKDIVIGTPVAGRMLPETESLIGLFINTVVLRTRLDPALSFDELLQANKAGITAAFDQQHIPFEMLVESVGHKRSQSYSPLFQVWFVLQNNREVHFALPGCTVSEYADVPAPAAKHELNLYAKESGGEIKLEWVFNPDIFDSRSIGYVAQEFLSLLQSIVDEPGRPCLDHQVFAAHAARLATTLVPAAVQHIIAEPAGLRRTLVERLYERPSATAIVCNGVAHTYRELAELSEQYVAAIRHSGSTSRIGLLLERSADMVAAMLGSLGLVRTYVALDPTYPRARLEYMVQHAGCDLLITDDAHRQLAEDIGHGISILNGAELNGPGRPAAGLAESAPVPVALALLEAALIGSDLSEDDPIAYILYTSGSTGQPKGVFQSHVGLAYHAGSYAHGLGLLPDDRILQLASYSFDASVLDTYGALLAGAALHLADVKAMSGERLLRMIETAQITVYHSTPTVFKQLFSDIGIGSAASLRLVVLGGEPVDPQTIKLFRQVFGDRCRLIGLYGATESSLTMLSECWQADIDTDVRSDLALSNLGCPIDGIDVLIRRADGKQARVFEIGELVIRGRHLAQGYWADSDLTAERFLRDETGMVEYLTGDTGYLLPDGSIRFVGRRDFQVKLNGIRIELGEIESTLLQLADVTQAAVAIVSDGAAHNVARLVAYVAAISVDIGADPSVRDTLERQAIAAYRKYLAQWLPDYMVPSAFAFMAALPLSPSGKVDRKALLKTIVGPPRSASYVAPRRQLEQLLCEVWQDVLQLDQIGVHDHFFDVGGTSLLAMQVCRKISERATYALSVIDMFAYPTVEALARFLSADAALAQPDETVLVDPRSSSDVAVIGVACRFPGADHAATFWSNLAGGVESIRFYTPDELRQAGVPSTLIDQPHFVPARSLLDGVEDFDAAYFAFTPREAEVTDPQQRLLLECADEALESAGYGDAAQARPAGVFVGVGANLYYANHLLPQIDTFAGLGALVVHSNSRDHHAATRISYKLNLSGPSVSVNTACSTALVAVHQACRSLALGECRMALAGGSSVAEFGPGGYLYQEGDILSPDGHCRAFDRDAAGTRRGNGAGVVLLKRLDEALADGDTIHAVIKSSAINNDGSDKVGYTAPSVSGQAKAIGQAYRTAGLAPSSVQYVEMHGTGTVLGDPIELRALSQAFAGVAAQSCAIGSVKPNIGHLDAAAGVAGLIKAVEALKHRQLPPSLHYVQPNPQIDFASSPFYVNTQLRAWPASAGPRRAGVSAFGIGGTNAHVVLEEAPASVSAPAARATQLLLLSARSAASLQVASERLATHLAADHGQALADIAYTLHVGRMRHAHRRAVVCTSAAEAIAQLAQPVSGHAVDKADAGVSPVWLFTGQGAQHVDMAHDLYTHEAVFRQQLDTCAEGLHACLGVDLRSLLYPGADTAAREAAAAQLSQTQWAQPALFAVEYSLARLLQSWGLQPEAMIGHSLGEYVAACVAGVISLDDGLRLVATRGRLMQAMAPGAMLSLAKDAAWVIAQLDGSGCGLAAINGATQCVVSGPVAAIAALQQRLAAAGVDSRQLQTSHAFHSAMMEPMLAAWRAELAAVTLHAPTLPYLSNLSGQWIRPEEATDPEYWVRHLRETVRFADGIDTVLASTAPLKARRALLELGPGQVLSSVVRKHAQAKEHLIVPLLRHVEDGQDDTQVLHKAIGQLWVAGLTPDGASYHGPHRRRVPLPTYPFERQRFWVEAPRGGQATSCGVKNPRHEDWFYAPLWRLSSTKHKDTLLSQRHQWLLFLDDRGIGERLAQQLREAQQAVIVVRPGDRFEQIDASDYVIPIDSASHYAQLLRQVSAEGAHIDHLVHMGSLTQAPAGERTDAEAFEASQRHGYDSLLLVIQALAASALGGTTRCHVVTHDAVRVSGMERIVPEGATVMGLCKVAPQEYPRLRCRHIDMSLSGQASLAVDVAAAAAQALFDELMLKEPETTVALRAQTRWTQIFEQQCAPSGPVPAAFKPGGVYLITGGLGKVGYALAEHLASTVQARLVLIVRDPLPERAAWAEWIARDPHAAIARQLTRLLVLESCGGQVLAYTADVADATQMAAAFAVAEAAFGAIDGVIHCAGQLRESVRAIAESTVEHRRAQCRAKVQGVLVLEQLLLRRRVDFCLLMSSLSAVLGGLGFAAYAAANAYMDAFAQAKHAEGDTAWLSINWDGWHIADSVGAPPSPTSMTAAEGAAALTYVLTWADVPQLVHSTGELKARFQAPIDQTTPEAATSQQIHHRDPGKVAFQAPRNDIEQWLLGIWHELIGQDGIGVYDNFFELGGNSLLATRLLSRIREAFPVLVNEYSMRAFFEAPTIEAVAEKISSTLMGKLVERQKQVREGQKNRTEGVF